MPSISLKPEENDPPQSVRITRCAAICGTKGDGGLACSNAEGTDWGRGAYPATSDATPCKFTRWEGNTDLTAATLIFKLTSQQR